MAKRKSDPKTALERYRAKRSAGGTPEPFGDSTAHRPRLFVVQKHSATRLHYDFRIEFGGTLLSWAVPKRPSRNPEDKRYAVRVEDHPVEYADFEGVIPKGNYGAGPVIVWDRGLWTTHDPDVGEALAKGVLHVDLHGYKLRGSWMLVRLQDKGGKDWLLIKKKDGFSRNDDDEDPPPETSVFSGLTLEEMRDGTPRTAAAVRKLRRRKVPETALAAPGFDLMLAETGEGPFTDPAWLFELKYDGWRLLAEKREDGTPYLRSRNGHDLTGVFPEVARAVRSLPYPRFLLDGELVVLDDRGHPDFGRLQKRAKLARPRDIDRAVVELPATLFVFDLPSFAGFDLRKLPLKDRKGILAPLLPEAGPVRYADHVVGAGEAMYDAARDLGVEGIMAKQASSPYLGGRSPRWKKLPLSRTGDFVVCGFTAPKGARVGIGALHLGAYVEGRLVYVGRVGTGFTDDELRTWAETLSPRKRKTPPCRGVAVKSAGHFWVRPERVVEVEYKTLTHEGNLRHPRFLREREDKDPEECVLEGPLPTGSTGADDPPEPPRPAPMEKTVNFTNLDKVFWPEAGYTKGNLLEYYAAVKDWILPYLADRPLVLTRYPDGIEGKSFYQKNAPDFVPSWVRTESVYSESSGKEVRYLVCDDVESLLYIVNSGAIPLHLWSSRVADLPHPDWCILDLDPKGAPFRDVVTLARAIHDLGEEIGLPTRVKTSGSTGLHVLIPLGGQCTYEQSRTLGHLLSRVIEARHPGIATTARHIPSRKGRVYLDYLQNRHGQLLVAPYSVRPLPGAPVSAPLEWKEVNGRLDPRKYHLGNILARLRRRKKDPVLDVLTVKPDLVTALAALSEEIADLG